MHVAMSPLNNTEQVIQVKTDTNRDNNKEESFSSLSPVFPSLKHPVWAVLGFFVFMMYDPGGGSGGTRTQEATF